MKSLRDILGCAALVTLLLFAPLASLRADSLWGHAQSTLRLEVLSGEWRVFRFEAPSEALKALGVDEGTVSFLGAKRGRRFAGQAFLFPPAHCELPPRGFLAAGMLTDFGRRLVLAGEAISVGQDCKPLPPARVEVTYSFLKALRHPTLLRDR